jgi:hypothetical protein
MRVALLLLLGLSLATGCGGMLPRLASAPEGQRLEAEFAQAWDAVVQVLLDRGFSLHALDQKAGGLETTWETVNADYSASVFVTRSDDTFSNCGRPGVGEAFRGKSARIIGALAPHPRSGTLVTLRAEFRTQRYSTFGWGQDTPLGTVECQSRGWLETELAALTQARAVKDQLERVRRGAY